MDIRTMKKPVVAALILIVFLAGFLFTMATQSQGAYATSPYKINSNGQTYGTIEDVPKDGEMPELLAAETTDGKIGYVYWEELDGASPSAKNPDDAIRMMEERAYRNAKPFCDYLSEELEVAIETDSESAKKAYDAAFEYVTTRGSEGEPILDSRVGKKRTSELLRIDESLLPDGDELLDLLSSAISKAHDEFYVEIPVYLEDGKTQIGVCIALV